MTKPIESAANFFNEIGDRYDLVISRCVPRYHEMLDQMLDYLPNPIPNQILELGCGSGNLTQKLLDRFPNSQITVVDASEKMLSIVQERFQQVSRLKYIDSFFQDLKFERNTFDLIVSSISIHHLNDDEKLELFKQSHAWLINGSPFTFCDQFSGQSEEIYSKHISNWKQASFEMGATEAEWADWMEHQNVHDYHSSIQTHFELLGAAGFELVDCIRRHFLWTTLYCQ